MVIRKIMEQHKEELKVFASSMKKQGFIDELKSFFAEVYQYDVSMEDLKKITDGMKEEGLRSKMEDILLVMENFEDYIVEFEQPETAACAQLTDDGLINNNDRIPILDHETVIPVKHSLFYKDALIFDQLKSRTVALKHKESGHGILVTFPDFDYLGVWSSANDGPFVALEPWSGTSTCSDEDDVFEHKRGVRFLEPGEHETLSFVIEIL